MKMYFYGKGIEKSGRRRRDLLDYQAKVVVNRHGFLIFPELYGNVIRLRDNN